MSAPVAGLPSAPLGRTGLTVSRIGFGCAPLGDFFDRLDERQCLDTVAAAHAAGVTLFDVAPHYGNGLAEHRLGTALRGMDRGRIVLSSKVGRYMVPQRGAGPARGFTGGLPHRAVFDYSHDGTLRAVEQSLLRLGTDRLDLALIHDVDDWTHGVEGAEARFAEAMQGAVPALERLKAEGVVGAIGLGLDDHVFAERFLRAGDFDVLLLAGRYSLLEQPAAATLLPLAAAQGVGVILGGVFNSGILATGAVAGARYNYDPAPEEIMSQVARIEAVCAAHGTPLPVAALHFALGHPAVASVVLGAVHPQEVTRNIAALDAVPPAALWSDLRAEGLISETAVLP
ncbi:aldo/keto reductase [Pseudooceanicola sp. 502str34]